MTTLSAPTGTGGGGGGGATIDTGSSSTEGDTGSVASTDGSVAGGEVLGATTYNFTLDMRYGSLGDEVSELQKLLGDLYKGRIDGIFGPLTRQAVRDFQEAHGLKVDGIVGPETRAMLNKVQEEQAAQAEAESTTETA